MRLESFLRNSACGLLALGVIASGRTRRAKAIAFSGDVITPIYFHNPNKRLFQRCIAWLRENGYTFITAEQVIAFLRCGTSVPRGAVWLSCDDAYREWLDVMLPVIRDAGVPVTMFVPSGVVENGGQLPWVAHTSDQERDTLTVSDLRTVAQLPQVTIGGHTVSHAITVDLPEERARYELGHSRLSLESWTDAAVECFAYPEGLYDGRERPILIELKYQMAVTTRAAFITRNTDPYEVPRFCVPDNVWFAEAICNMLGVWRPAIDPVLRRLRRRPKLAFSD
jgi:poly-beta-1,6-N-acetyl-D-glucosamine N-deacetylase